MIAVVFYLEILAAMAVAYLVADLIWCRFKAIRKTAQINARIRLQRVARTCERTAR